MLRRLAGVGGAAAAAQLGGYARAEQEEEERQQELRSVPAVVEPPPPPAVPSRLELKFSIIKKVAEIEERTKWEATRLNAVMREAEDECRVRQTMVHDIALEALESEQAARTRAREASHMDQLAELTGAAREAATQRLEAELTEHAAVKGAEWSTWVDGQLKEASDASEADLKREVEDFDLGRLEIDAGREASLAQLGAALKRCERQIELKAHADESQTKLHRDSLLMLQCVEALQGCKPSFQAVQTLLKNDDEMVILALASLDGASLERGVPRLDQLAARFSATVEPAMRAWLMIPEGMDQGLLGHIIGTVLATLLLARPTTSLKTEDDSLALASAHLRRGDLAAALASLEKATRADKGEQPAQDWISDAQTRLKCDQAAKLLRAKTALLNAAASH